MTSRKKIIRISTIPTSLNVFCKDLLKDLSADYDVVAVSSPGKPLDQLEKREGVRTIAVPMERRMSLFKDLKALISLVRVFRKERPDLVHSITPKAGLLGMMAARLAGVKVRVHTFTGLVFPTATGLKRRILKATDRMTCRCATHIIPEGEGVKRDLEKGRVTKKPMKILGFGNVRGIDLDWYARTPEVMEKAGEFARKDVFTFIFIGRIAKDKGVEELVAAFLKLLGDRKDVRLLLAGEWEFTDPVSPQTESFLKNTEEINWVGSVPDVRPYLAASDCLVLPSYREGFPNSVIEAGALGLPCVVTDINGANEIIAEGENGLIVPAKDSASLYSAMKLIAEDKELYSKLKEAARPMVASRYERGFVWSCLKAFYKEALKDV